MPAGRLPPYPNPGGICWGGGGGNLPGDNFPVTRKNDLIRKIRLILKIYYVTTWLTNNYKTQWQPDFFFFKKKTLGVCLLLSFNMIRHSSTWHAIKNSIKLFDYWSRYTQFWFFRKGSGNGFSTTFCYDFTREMYLALYSVTWPNFFA